MKQIWRYSKMFAIGIGIFSFLFIVVSVIVYWDDTETETPDPFLAQQQILDGKLEEARKQSELATEELKKEIENLKSKTTKQAQNQQQADNKIVELKNELKSTDTLLNENYDEQSNVVLDSIAKVVCFLNKNKTISGSGSVWGVGNDYYLVTNKHVYW